MRWRLERTGALTGKVALVTGGGRGLGRAIAQRLAAEGARVWSGERSASSPHEVATPESGEVTRVRLDVTVEREISELFQKISETNHILDILVNNAGTGVYKPFMETTTQEWHEAFNTNVVGTAVMTRYAIPLMRDGGRIVQLGSVAGINAIPNNSAYGASKAALRHLTLTLADELKSTSIRLTTLNLGATLSGNQLPDGFSASDMLTVDHVATTVLDIVRQPLAVRMDELTLLPPKGIL